MTITKLHLYARYVSAIFLVIFILSPNLSLNTSGRTKRGIQFLYSTTIPRVNRSEIGLTGHLFTYTLHFVCQIWYVFGKLRGLITYS